MVGGLSFTRLSRTRLSLPGRTGPCISAVPDGVSSISAEAIRLPPAASEDEEILVPTRECEIPRKNPTKQPTSNLCLARLVLEGGGALGRDRWRQAGKMVPVTVVEDAWSAGMFRMEVWMTAATANSLLFLPDPDMLVCGEADGTVRVLYEKTRGPTSIEKVHGGGVTSLVHATSAQTNLLFASTGEDGNVRLWAESERKAYFEAVSTHDLDSAEENCDCGQANTVQTDEIAVQSSAQKPKQRAGSLDGSLLSLSGSTRIVHYSPTRATVTVLDVVQLSGADCPGLVPLFLARDHVRGVKHAATFDDYISTVDQENTFRVWSSRSRAKVVEIDGTKLGDVTCLWARGSNTLIFGRGDGSIDVREFPRGESRHVIERHSGKVTHIELIDDIIISGGEDIEGPTGRDCVRFCNARTGHKLASFTTAPVTCMCVRTECGKGVLSGSRFALTGHLDGKAVLWDVSEQRSAHILDGHHKAARSVHANRFCAVSGGDDSTCRVWRFADASVIAREREELDKRAKRAESISEEARAAYGARRFKEALRLWSEAAKLAPAVHKFQTNIAAVYFEMGDNEACIRNCRQFLSNAREAAKGPEEGRVDETLVVKAYGRLASALARGGNVDVAVRCLQEALQHLPENSKLKQQLDGLTEDPAETARRRGREAYRARDLPEALGWFSKAVELCPGNVTHWANRSAALYETGDHLGCLRDCDAALELPEMRAGHPGARAPGGGAFLGTLSARLLARKGNAHRALKDEENALMAFEQALTRVTEGSEEALELGGAFFSGLEQQRNQLRDEVRRKQNPEREAQERAERCAAVRREVDRGDEMFMARRFGDALEHFKKGATLDPEDPTLLLKQAHAHFEMNATALAFAACDRAAEIALAQPGRESMASTALWKKGELWLRKATLRGTSYDTAEAALKCAAETMRAAGNHPAAGEDQRAAAQLGLGRVEAEIARRKQLGACKEETANGDRMFADGQFASAVAFYDKAVEADPECSGELPHLLYSSRGACQLHLQRHRQALADADMTIKLKRDFTTGHILRARVCEALQDWSGMMRSAINAHNLEPLNETALVLCRDALVSLLGDENVRRSGKHLGDFSKGGSAVLPQKEMQEILRDPKVQVAIQAMQRARDLQPLRPVLDDLPVCAKFCKLLASGLLVQGK